MDLKSVFNIYSFSAVSGLLTAYVGYKFLKIYLLRKKYSHIPGPKTNGIFEFFFGNIGEINELRKRNKCFPELLKEWYDKYGPVFKYQLSDYIFVLVSDSEATKEILIEKNYPKIKLFSELFGFPFNERFIGKGLLTEPNNEIWKLRRAIFNKGFHRQTLMTFISQFNAVSDILMDRLNTMADGKTVITLFKEINRATLDAIGLIAFNMNIDSVSNRNNSFNDSIALILDVIERLVFEDPLAQYKPSKRKEIAEAKKCMRSLREIGRQQILKKLESIKNEEYLGEDILTNILNSSTNESKLDLETMIDDFVTFFIAGQETTANALAFCFLEIGKNPEVLEKVRNEVDRVVGKKSEITYQDVNELKYCMCVFKETLRLFPPATFFEREILEPMIVKGYKIPENSVLQVSTFVNCRIEENFPNALEFKPERFMKNENKTESSIPNYTYTPFSLGPRNCIGQTFAQIEAIIMIAKLIQRFDFSLDPHQSMHIEEKITLRPVDGTRCFIKNRN